MTRHSWIARAIILISSIFLVSILVGCQQESSTSEEVADVTLETALPTAAPDSGSQETQAELPPPSPTPPPPVVVVSEGDGVPAEPAGDGPEDGTSATAVPIPEGLIGPNDFPPNTNPLTGETVSDAAKLARRPVAVKISNAPAVVRPQSGLNSADLVFEHYAEGGLTRFTAVFYGNDADPVGSIRSGRFIDIEIPQMYDAGFAYSGSSGPLQLMFRNGAFFDRIISPDFGHGGFFRVEDPNKAFEHTLFTSTYNLRNILEQRGENTPPDFQSNMAFSAAPLHPGVPANRIELQYDGTNVTWAYNAGTGRYTRWTDGIPHLDANSGQQLAFKNVVAIAAHHENTDILEDHVGGGHYSIQIQLWGEGPASVFRDGQRIEGVWRRQDPSHMLTFFDLDGNILPLAPGNTFFQVVPLGFERLYATP